MSITCKRNLIKFTLALVLTTGCGKQAENTVPDSMGKYASTPALTISSLPLEISFDQEQVIEADQYEFSQNAWIVIPEAHHIQVKSGDPEHYRTRIYFNSTDEIPLDGTAELYCEYVVTKERTEDKTDSYKSTFNGCYEDVDSDGSVDLMNYSPGTQIVQSSGKKIRFVFEFGYSEYPAQIYTELDIVDWF